MCLNVRNMYIEHELRDEKLKFLSAVTINILARTQHHDTTNKVGLYTHILLVGVHGIAQVRKQTAPETSFR